LVASLREIRATFVFLSSALVQILLKPDAVDLPWAEHPHQKTAGSFEDWFYKNHAASIASSINSAISAIPPFRLSLFSFGDERYLAVSAHHSVYDGISMPLLLNKVSATYHDERIEATASLKTVLNALATRGGDEAKDYFTSSFKGFNGYEPLDLPEHEPALVYQRKVSFKYSQAKALASTSRLTLQSLLCSIFANSIRKQWRQEDNMTIGVCDLLLYSLLIADDGDSCSDQVALCPSRMQKASSCHSFQCNL
jgi:hypothetical protein